VGELTVLSREKRTARKGKRPRGSIAKTRASESSGRLRKKKKKELFPEGGGEKSVGPYRKKKKKKELQPVMLRVNFGGKDPRH